MFTLGRYGLIPVVLFCGLIVVASIDTYWTNITQKSTWPETVVTVTQSQDPGQVAADVRGTKNTFPDPHGTVRYVVDGQTYTWQGRGRDIGVTVMKPGDTIKVHYNPKNPREINTLVLLGAFTGNIILAFAIAFLAFYVWFFWLRGFLRRSGLDDFDGDTAGSFADRALKQLPGQIEQSHPTFADQRRTVIDNGPTGRSFDRGRAPTFGKRPS